MGIGDTVSPVRVINRSRETIWCLISGETGWEAYPLEPGQASNSELDIDGVSHFQYGEPCILVPDGRVNKDTEWWRISSNGRNEDVEITGPSPFHHLKMLKVVGGLSVRLRRQDESDPELRGLTYWTAFPGQFPPEAI